MKKFLLIALLFISNLFSQQTSLVFSELKGIEDQSYNTQLFYRLYGYWENSFSFEERNDIYRLDLENNIDTIFLVDYSYYYPFLGGSSVRVYDFDFWNNNYSEYVYCFVSGGFFTESPVTQILRFDSDGGYMNISRFASAEISEQNDSLVYGTNGYFVKSTDGGRNWEELGTNFGLIALSPFNDSVLFGLGDGGLLKSDNGGNSFFIVDTNKSNWPDYNNIYGDILFDKDSLHVYRFYQNGSSYNLSVSNNEGNAFSWGLKYSSFQKIFISVDYSQTGSIYLADGKYIYHSTDFGLTFNEYKVLDRKIVGIYKKPNSDKLYAATKYDLYEITLDTTIVIKHLPIDPDLFNWYPLAVGNKWIYDYEFFGDTLETGTIVQEVTGDTIINNQQYFILNNSSNYIRVDSLTGRIYRAFSFAGILEENLFTDLTLDVGDTLSYDSTDFRSLTVLSEQSFYQWNLNTRIRFFDDFGISIVHNYSFVKGIGLFDELWWELVGSHVTLRGCVIDGIVYGDTTTVGVNDPPEQPKEFSLSQNYPNPFNPTTNIGFRIANFGFVSLKVFDVLGREVATLVNEEKQPGEYDVEFNASHLSSGIYFYKLQTENYSSIKKMLMIK
ncbi:MAG: hypothetical protein A2W11_08220 [Ignavibacteria bacterium RBG_16_35_7]|nr:MAG: hypothetical protein A2W11_08220 [Ignavibacteria bacterium RBG_16_35_7]